MTSHNLVKMSLVVIALGGIFGESASAAGVGYLTSNAVSVVAGTVSSRVEGSLQVSFTINVTKVLKAPVHLSWQFRLFTSGAV